ncbi:LutC/YkgG family protein [Telluribacter sp.]|jgi:L-lactate dehydrogenase complex protein LldG|uniref:LutC/YkgG family protein n=1 Tax=Telluribacter sp. TaxID=1978767 RepID=UPI002E153E85|nr:LUD domain-containing protein [Telluribacter sp.]
MSTREKILGEVLQNQPPSLPLPDLSVFRGEMKDVVQKYRTVFESIGGDVYLVDDLEAIKAIIKEKYDLEKRIVTTLPELTGNFEWIAPDVDPHTYEDIELAIINAHFSVAENGAVWLSDEVMGQRIIPYICQHLAVVVRAESIVPTLHEAYEIIGEGTYGFGGFIGGPSKTADIEQALVLGAHGPLSMAVFVIG